MVWLSAAVVPVVKSAVVPVVKSVVVPVVKSVVDCVGMVTPIQGAEMGATYGHK